MYALNNVGQNSFKNCKHALQIALNVKFACSKMLINYAGNAQTLPKKCIKVTSWTSSVAFFKDYFTNNADI